MTEVCPIPDALSILTHIWDHMPDESMRERLEEKTVDLSLSLLYGLLYAAATEEEFKEYYRSKSQIFLLKQIEVCQQEIARCRSGQ